MVLIQQIASSLSSPSSSSSRPTKPLPSKGKGKDTKLTGKSGKGKQGDADGREDEMSPAEKVVDRYFRTFYASLHDPRLFTSGKQAMYLNLLFKVRQSLYSVPSRYSPPPPFLPPPSHYPPHHTTPHRPSLPPTLPNDTSNREQTAKSDPSPSHTRAKSIIRRFLQVLATVGCGGGGGAEFVCGGLFLLGELFASVPGLRGMVNSSPASSSSRPKASKASEEAAKEETYDPLNRNPLYAHPSASPLWELLPLVRHHHPAVALHARQLLRSEPVTASADLSQGTLMGFLDKYVSLIPFFVFLATMLSDPRETNTNLHTP